MEAYHWQPFARAMSLPAPPYRSSDEGVEVDEGSGNDFHLAPVLRRYSAAAKLTMRGPRRVTSCTWPALYDALGLLRSLQYDLRAFNSAHEACTAGSPLPPSALRYAVFRLSRQASAFGVRLPRPGAAAAFVPGLDALVAEVEARNAESLALARALLAGGLVDFSALGELHTPGTDLLDRGLATGVFGVPTAMRVRACYYSRGKTLFGSAATFHAALECVVSVGEGRLAVVEAQLPVPEFTGTRSTAEGVEHLVLLGKTLQRELAARGSVYVAMACSGGSSAGGGGGGGGGGEGAPAVALVEYEQGAFLPAPRAGLRAPLGFGASRGRAAGGRMVVDTRAAWAHGVHCARAEGSACAAVVGVLKLVSRRVRVSAGCGSSSGDGSGGGGGGGGGEGGAAEGGAAAATAPAEAEADGLELLLLSPPLPPALLHLTWPVLAGFSFSAKAWGVALVGGLRPAAFNDAAFERLVLPEARKRLLKALVLRHGSSGGGGGCDVMAGKGEDTIFLLHGPPGCGKTLTAEATAELLHRPLYTVSMGELGTSPEALEERLADILALCAPWGALVLIDEAEMLLEARSRGEVVRNAMVCVTLRLLEYFSGILFLTTNRVQCLDPAFASRVQCALRYSALDEGARGAIWRDLLARVPGGGGVGGGVDAAALARVPLNGRQIKNVLQLALALSASEGSDSGSGGSSGSGVLAMRHLEATMEITTAFVGEMAGEGGGAAE